MKKLTRLIMKSSVIMTGLVMIIFLAMGCSNFDSPTMSQSAAPSMDLWNPQPGEQVVPGRDIPLYENGSNSLTVDGVIIRPVVVPADVVIGPAGGTVRLGLHTLIVPAGAVDRDITITLTYASLTAIAVDCGPSPFHFNVPVELRLSYAGTTFDLSEQQNTLQIFYMASSLSCTAMPSTVDVVNKTVTARLDHFSRYIIS